jgi:hypothetical protein
MTSVRTEADQAADPNLERIRKALLLAQDEGATEGEREQANRMAARLAAKYGIDMAMASANRPAGHADEMVLKEFGIDSDFPALDQRLLSVLMRSMGCQCIRTNGDHELSVVGYPSDIAAAEVLYVSLGLQMVSGVIKVDGDHEKRKGWMLGFIDAVAVRCEEARRAAKGDADSTSDGGASLVLASRELAVIKAFDAEFPNRVKSRARRFDYSAYGAGAAAGRRATMGGTSVDASGQKALT